MPNVSTPQNVAPFGDPSSRLAAGHVSVMRREVIEFLAPKPGGRYCDATLGMGGHAEAILEASGPSGRLWGLDRDPYAMDVAERRLRHFGERARLHRTLFSNAHEVLRADGALPLDGVLADLGVSSPQLDRAERGFSFRQAGPLDMRMDPTQGMTAADYLAEVDEGELESVLRELGEERFARAIARAIVAERSKAAITDTLTLAGIVARAVPTRERHKDPATRTFQALRLVVNQELRELDRFLATVPETLAPGGRLVIIAFHSLEDRIVKRRFKALAGAGEKGVRLRILTKHVVWPSDQECKDNPRARSARLRAAERVIDESETDALDADDADTQRAETDKAA